LERQVLPPSDGTTNGITGLTATPNVPAKPIEFGGRRKRNSWGIRTGDRIKIFVTACTTIALLTGINSPVATHIFGTSIGTGIIIDIVCVVTFFIALNKAITTRGIGTSIGTAVGICLIAVVAFLTIVDDLVAATLLSAILSAYRIGIIAIGLTVVAFFVAKPNFTIAAARI